MVTKRYFGDTPAGEKVTAFKIGNSFGEFVEVLDYGATVFAISVKDGFGGIRDVNLGYDTVAEYISENTHFGATIGRTVNRISGCKFTLNGKTYELADNDGGVSIHGGFEGFDRKMFDAEVCGEESVIFSRLSPDGEENYPGNLEFSVKFTFGDDHALVIDYNAVSDADTIFMPTNHSYFNLDGHDSGHNIYSQKLLLNAGYVTPLGADFTPSGELAAVEGTPYDFTEFKEIGRDIDEDNAQLKFAGGYDINFVLKNGKPVLPEKFAGVTLDSNLNFAALAYSDESGICMAVETDLPCTQLYTGNFMKQSGGKLGTEYNRRFAFCLETQGYPDAINKPQFPSIVLKKGEKFESRTVYAFGVVK